MCQNLDLRFLLLLPFVKFLSLLFFAFLTKRFIVFSLFYLIFYSHLFSSSFCYCFVLIFYVVLSLVYPNLFGNKRLYCCCWEVSKYMHVDKGSWYKPYVDCSNSTLTALGVEFLAPSTLFVDLIESNIKS
jgi:hypothetical protein